MHPEKMLEYHDFVNHHFRLLPRTAIARIWKVALSNIRNSIRKLNALNHVLVGYFHQYTKLCGSPWDLTMMLIISSIFYAFLCSIFLLYPIPVGLFCTLDGGGG